MKNLFIGVLVGVILVFVGYGAYIAGRNINIFLPTKLEIQTPPPTIESVPISDVPVEIKSNEIADENMVLIQSEIMQAVSQGNYQDLGNMMDNNVEVILYASECCGSIPKADAVKQLEYLNSAQKPWYFGSDNSDITQIATKDPEKYGPPNIIGVSKDKMVVSFKLTSDGLVKRIIIVPRINLIQP